MPFSRRISNRSLICGLFLTIFANGAFSESTAEPIFLEEPTDQEANPGDSIDIRCRLNQPMSGVTWLKDGRIQNTRTGVYVVISDSTTNSNTLRISGISVTRDDGFWECQAEVPGKFDLIGSRKARITVRVPPGERPTMQAGDKQMRNGDEMQVRADLNATVTCIARESNPPSTIKWWIGSKEVTENVHSTSEKSGKLFNTISTLTYQFVPDDNSGQLKCEVTHPALAGSLTTYAHLSVLYAPVISILQDPHGDIVESTDVTLTCLAPANPPSQVRWSRNGQELAMTNSTSIILERVNHESAGNYTCTARNPGFDPVRENFALSIRYAPSFTVHPQSANVDVDQPLTLYCEADGSPEPQIVWFHNTTDGQTFQRGSEHNLTLNADYSSQGKYWCTASNSINDKENIVASEAAELIVKGPPKFEASVNQRSEIIADRNADVVLAVTYCSQPPPTGQYWQKEQRPSDKTKTPSPIVSSPKKYETITRELGRPGCYESRLKILQVDVADGGRYKFWVENDKGPNALTLMLNVRDINFTPVIVGVVVGLGSALILGLLVLICCYRSKRCCFATKKAFQHVDIEKREVKPENGQKEENLKQNPLQPGSLYHKSDRKPNGVHASNGNGNVHMNGRLENAPSSDMHYANLDGNHVAMETGHAGTPGLDRHERTGFNDIQPTVL